MGNSPCGSVPQASEGSEYCLKPHAPVEQEDSVKPIASSERPKEKPPQDEQVKEPDMLEVTEPPHDVVAEVPPDPEPEEPMERLKSVEVELARQKAEEYEKALTETRRVMKEDPGYGRDMPANRYGTQAELPAFESHKHVPVLGLLNPMSGAKAGMDIMQIARRTPYYQDRFFNIVSVMKESRRRGGLMDVFRLELIKAKEEAKAIGTRPRLISGGGDGTGSFAVAVLFLALKANDERKEDGLADTGNGFIWTDAELEETFPALAQLPLGSANDFGNILGWGQKYPGDGCSLCNDRASRAAALYRWIDSVISPTTRIANFDVWGIMPPRGQEKCNFKIAELTGKRGSCPNQTIDGVRQLQLKEAGHPVPFFIMLYFSCGFGAYMTARFQINRHNTPLKNRAEYTWQAIGIIKESPPPQMHLRLNGIEIDCESQPYFPPRRDAGVKGRGYREVGFYNINWQAHLMHGADRASVGNRLTSTRTPVRFNDGLMDMYRWKFLSILKNPGLRVQTDKKKDLHLTFNGAKGKGCFFQWDGEARFAFSPTGDPFNIFIRKALSIPVVLGPFLNEGLTGPVDNGQEVKFGFAGDTAEEKDQVRRRVLDHVSGNLASEIIATKEELVNADMKVWDVPVDEK